MQNELRIEGLFYIKMNENETIEESKSRFLKALSKEDVEVGNFVFSNVEINSQKDKLFTEEKAKEFVQSNEKLSIVQKEKRAGIPGYILDTTVKLMDCFPKSKVLLDRDPIEFVAHERGNIYFILGNCKDTMEIDCKVLEWFSRAAYKTEPYQTKSRNEAFHDYFLAGINRYFGHEFTKEDIENIYTYLGNACNHTKTVAFIESGFDMSVLDSKFEKDEDYER